MSECPCFTHNTTQAHLFHQMNVDPGGPFPLRAGVARHHVQIDVDSTWGCAGFKFQQPTANQRRRSARDPMHRAPYVLCHVTAGAVAFSCQPPCHPSFPPATPTRAAYA
jgi:hypothetical protein